MILKIHERAEKEGISPEELARDAVEARLSRAEWRKTLEYGERNARKRGLKPEDVKLEIAASEPNGRRRPR